MQGKVEVSGVNTARLKVLTNEQTMALLRRAKAGDSGAREELISGNLRLVQRQGGESGRPLSGGLRGPHQGHRRL